MFGAPQFVCELLRATGDDVATRVAAPPIQH